MAEADSDIPRIYRGDLSIVIADEGDTLAVREYTQDPSPAFIAAFHGISQECREDIEYVIEDLLDTGMSVASIRPSIRNFVMLVLLGQAARMTIFTSEQEEEYREQIVRAEVNVDELVRFIERAQVSEQVRGEYLERDARCSEEDWDGHLRFTRYLEVCERMVLDLTDLRRTEEDPFISGLAVLRRLYRMEPSLYGETDETREAGDYPEYIAREVRQVMVNGLFVDDMASDVRIEDEYQQRGFERFLRELDALLREESKKEETDDEE